MRHFHVPDTRRLMDAGAGLGEDFADALVVEFDPALDHVVHLKIQRMLVPAGAPVMGGLRPDDMRHGASARRLLDPEVAIDEERSQPPVFEAGVLGVRCGKFHVGAHPMRPPRAYSLWTSLVAAQSS